MEEMFQDMDQHQVFPALQQAAGKPFDLSGPDSLGRGRLTSMIAENKPYEFISIKTPVTGIRIKRISLFYASGFF